MADRRTVMVAARVTPAEHAAWQDKAAAAGVSPSVLLRQAMARTRTWTAPALAIERERSRQIARIGNNLNQLARWANTDAAVVEVVDGDDCWQAADSHQNVHDRGLTRAVLKRRSAMDLVRNPRTPGRLPDAPPPRRDRLTFNRRLC